MGKHPPGPKRQRRDPRVPAALAIVLGLVELSFPAHGSWDVATGGAGGGSSSTQTRKLPRGTLLVGDEPLGVVIDDIVRPCVGACDTDEPEVTIHACGGTIRVRARMPRD